MTDKSPSDVKPRLRGTGWRVAIALCFLVLGTYSIASYVAFEHDAVHVPGTVKSIERHQHRTGRRGGKVSTVRPHVEFTPAGMAAPVVYPTATDHRDEFDVGQKIDVEYVPGRVAQTVRVATGLPALDVAVAVAGLLLLAHALLRMLQFRHARLRQMPDPLSGSSGQLGQAPLKG